MTDRIPFSNARVSLGMLLIAFSPSLTAQGSSVPQIEAAAAVYARSHYASGKVVFDPRPAYLKGSTPSRTPQEIHKLGLLLGATSIADESEYLACSSAPKVCRMKGAHVIISINRPEVVGDTAYVLVRILGPGPSAKWPLTRREDRLLVVKRDGSWRFVKLVGGGSIT